MSRTCLLVLAVAAAAAAQAQQQYLPWEQQTDVGSIPAWYAPKTSGFAATAGSSMSIPPAFGSPSPYVPASNSYAARPSYPPNFPGYPTFGTVQPVGPGVAPKSGGIPYSFTTTYKPKTTTGYRQKPTGKSNLDKYLPLLNKKKASSTATSTTALPSTTRRRKLPARRTNTAVPRTTVTKRPSTTVRSTTVRPTTVRPTTTTEESGEWESLEVVEPKTSSTAPTTSTARSTTTEKRKEEMKKEGFKKLVKGPIVQKGRPDSTFAPPSTVTTTTVKSTTEEEAEFNLLGFLWDKSELLASIKNMIKQLKSSIDEAGLEEDVKQVGDHLKNTIKTFASASPVNEQLGRLFERAQNADVKLDD